MMDGFKWPCGPGQGMQVLRISGDKSVILLLRIFFLEPPVPDLTNPGSATTSQNSKLDNYIIIDAVPIAEGFPSFFLKKQIRDRFPTPSRSTLLVPDWHLLKNLGSTCIVIRIVGKVRSGKKDTISRSNPSLLTSIQDLPYYCITRLSLTGRAYYYIYLK